jgi:hypothetical protein
VIGGSAGTIDVSIGHREDEGDLSGELETRQNAEELAKA